MEVEGRNGALVSHTSAALDHSSSQASGTLLMEGAVGLNLAFERSSCCYHRFDSIKSGMRQE